MLVSRVTQSSGVELYLCSESSLLTVSILHCNRAQPAVTRGLAGAAAAPSSSWGGVQQRQRAGLAGTLALRRLDPSLLVALRGGPPRGSPLRLHTKGLPWALGYGQIRAPKGLVLRL